MQRKFYWVQLILFTLNSLLSLMRSSARTTSPNLGRPNNAILSSSVSSSGAFFSAASISPTISSSAEICHSSSNRSGGGYTAAWIAINFVCLNNGINKCAKWCYTIKTGQQIRNKGIHKSLNMTVIWNIFLYERKCVASLILPAYLLCLVNTLIWNFTKFYINLLHVNRNLVVI